MDPAGWTSWLTDVPDWVPPLERKWFTVRNKGAFLAAAVHSGLFATFLLLGARELALTEIAVVPIFLLLIPLQWAGWTRLVSSIAHTEANLHVALLSWFLGSVSGFHLYFFTLAVLPLLMFPPRDRALQAFFTVLPVVFWLLLELVPGAPPALAAIRPEALIVLHILNVWGAFSTLILSSLYFALASASLEHDLETERHKNWALLLNVMPERIARRLRDSPGVIADSHEAVTVLFADIAGFTHLSSTITPEALVALLDSIFSSFDQLAERHGVEKIKTIGDAYMAAAGVPGTNADHANAIARMALDMLEVIVTVRATTPYDLHLRIGVHTGPAMAGVIGGQGLRYDLWGDTVNTASRMESSGHPGRVQVSNVTAELLRDNWQLTDRGIIDVKGKGPMRTWWLERAGLVHLEQQVVAVANPNSA